MCIRDSIASTIDAVIAEFPQSVADYKAGKEKAFGFMVGQTMRRLKGKGSPRTVNGLLREKLDGVKFDAEAVKAQEAAAKAAKAQEQAEKEAQKKAQAAAEAEGDAAKNGREGRPEQLTAAEKALRRAQAAQAGGADSEDAAASDVTAGGDNRVAFKPNRYRTHNCGELRERCV